jgi:hypothetical protein
VRGLLANETVTLDGYHVHLDGVELDYVYQERRPKDVPIYIGATGMQMMELTGEIADGAVLNYLVSPSVQRGSARGARAGSRHVPGRTLADIDRPQLVVCSGRPTIGQAALDGVASPGHAVPGAAAPHHEGVGGAAGTARRHRHRADVARHARTRWWRRAGWCPTTSCR